MKKVILKIILILVLLYILLKIIQPILPDWMRIIMNADPRYIDHALQEAHRTCKYDRRE